MTEPAAPPKRRTGLLIWMIVSQLLAIGSLVIWAVVAGLSVMAFDEGSSPVAWAIVLTVWAYPLFPLLMAISAWVARAAGFALSLWVDREYDWTVVGIQSPPRGGT